ncbi:MAG: hypothetical protein V4736_02890 [Bdellovibrionota bacterium]
MGKILVVLLISGFFFSCSNPLAGGVDASTIGDDYQPGSEVTKPSSLDRGFKITPGGIYSKGTTLSVKANVLLERRKVAGTTIGARISLSKGSPK